jgi:hypothetical protein
MGNFFTLIKRGVVWIGKQIKKIFTWFINFLKNVAKKVVQFLQYVKNKILKADEPRKVGKYVAIKKHIEHLENLAKNLEKDMKQSDKDLCDNILNSNDNNSNFNDALDSKEFDDEIEKIFI